MGADSGEGAFARRSLRQQVSGALASVSGVGSGQGALGCPAASERDKGRWGRATGADSRYALRRAHWPDGLYGSRRVGCREGKVGQGEWAGRTQGALARCGWARGGGVA